MKKHMISGSTIKVSAYAFDKKRQKMLRKPKGKWVRLSDVVKMMDGLCVEADETNRINQALADEQAATIGRLGDQLERASNGPRRIAHKMRHAMQVAQEMHRVSSDLADDIGKVIG